MTCARGKSKRRKGRDAKQLGVQVDGQRLNERVRFLRAGPECVAIAGPQFEAGDQTLDFTPRLRCGKGRGLRG